jgi:FixJ family two-component response regulator
MAMVLVTIVDDDESVRRALQRLMKSAGLTADSFGSAEEFLQRGDRETACLILDVRLPGMSGLDLQRELAALNPRIPIIFMSAYGTEEMVERAIEKGAVAFLRKPFNQDLLLDDVRLALDARR